MIILLTKDGQKIGNAILYRVENGVVYAETDFGNHIKLNINELNELFTFGRMCSYENWTRDRELRRLGEEVPYPNPSDVCPNTEDNEHVPYLPHGTMELDPILGWITNVKCKACGKTGITRFHWKEVAWNENE